MKTHSRSLRTNLIGVQTRHSRAIANAETIRFAVGECTFGSVLVAFSSKGICAISLGDAPTALIRQLQDDFPSAQLIADARKLGATLAKVVEFIDDPCRSWDLPFDLRGTAFQRRVWQTLGEIPSGSTMTYTGVAKRVGAPDAVRAVASACAANKLAVAIPCHRVLRIDGSPTAYRWGTERKCALLGKETVA